MRLISWSSAIVLLAFTTAPSTPRANFLVIEVNSAAPVTVRAIWRPFAGSFSFEEQQARIRAIRGTTQPDSVRRWNDPGALDTVVAKSPTAFVVDMTAGPVVIETTGDSIRVDAQLTPRRGQLVSAWGKRLVVESDGITPSVTRAPAGR
jgi:hypothetical protein